MIFISCIHQNKRDRCPYPKKEHRACRSMPSNQVISPSRSFDRGGSIIHSLVTYLPDTSPQPRVQPSAIERAQLSQTLPFPIAGIKSQARSLRIKERQGEKGGRIIIARSRKEFTRTEIADFSNLYHAEQWDGRRTESSTLVELKCPYYHDLCFWFFDSAMYEPSGMKCRIGKS